MTQTNKKANKTAFQRGHLFLLEGVDIALYTK